jgi:hypothetical protein
VHKYLLYIRWEMLSILVVFIGILGCSAPASGSQPGQSKYAVFAAQWKAKGSDGHITVVGALSLHIGNQATLLTGSVMHEADGSYRVFGTMKDFSIDLPTGSIRCFRPHTATSGDVITGILQEAKGTIGIWSMHMMTLLGNFVRTSCRQKRSQACKRRQRTFRPGRESKPGALQHLTDAHQIDGRRDSCRLQLRLRLSAITRTAQPMAANPFGKAPFDA